MSRTRPGSLADKLRDWVAEVMKAPMCRQDEYRVSLEQLARLMREQVHEPRERKNKAYAEKGYGRNNARSQG